MKTEQEQIEQIEKVLKYSVADYKHLKKKGVCYCYAETLIDHGYGDISEYKAEIEDLKDEIIYLERKIAIRDNALKDRDKAIEMLEGKQDTIVKQAKIDVLNELKKRARTSYVLDDFILGSVVFSKDIDELIKEVQNGEDKG